MGWVWSWQGQLSRVQKQALGIKLQPLRNGWNNSSRVLGPQLRRLREVRAEHVVYRATQCWVGKLNQESCPPCLVNSWGPIQASDSQGNLAIQALDPWAIELSPSPGGLTLLPRHLLPVRTVSDLGSAESADVSFWTAGRKNWVRRDEDGTSQQPSLPSQDPGCTELPLPNPPSRASRPPKPAIQGHLGMVSPRALEGRT